ncbi:hypothetical protein ACSS6W_008062 [Trichoderma asperelloides]
MYETGGEEGSGFHVFNLAPDQYHRAQVLQRTRAIDITCELEKVIHGALSADSDYYATLMVMRWDFQPRNGRRISEATIELLFQDASDGGSIQSNAITSGGYTKVGTSQMADINFGYKWEKTVIKETSDAITLSGGRRLVNNRPPNRIAKWTISENETQPTGIPASLKIAVLVSREDQKKFYCKPALTCKTDKRTATESLFRKIPKDDHIIFQPMPHEAGTYPNKNVIYGDTELGKTDLDKIGDVIFRTLVTDAQKLRQ